MAAIIKGPAAEKSLMIQVNQKAFNKNIPPVFKIPKEEVVPPTADEGTFYKQETFYQT
jgi:hypothetical protein